MQNHGSGNKTGRQFSGLSLFFRLSHLLLRPAADGLQRGDQRPSALGEGVFHRQGDGRVLGAGNESVPLQLAQAFGQHGGRDADDFAFQLTVPERLILRIRDVPYSTGIAACGSVP